MFPHMPLKPKLIILEGPDGVGKTTLGLHLARHFDGMFYHCTATKTLIPAMRDYQLNVLENIKHNIALGRTVVIDRFWPSEMIYGGVLRPNNPHGFSWQELRDECFKLDAFYVVAVCESAIARHKVEKDPAHPYEDSVYAKIHREYVGFWQASKHMPDFMLYDMDSMGHDLDSVADLINVRFNHYYARKYNLAQ